MAEFSKQWCEINDPEIIGGFDIHEEISELPNEHYINLICEGFGFIAVGKNENGDIIFAFPKNDEEVEWKSYESIIK